MIADATLCRRCKAGECGALSPFAKPPMIVGTRLLQWDVDDTDCAADDGRIAVHLPRDWQPERRELHGEARKRGRPTGPFAPLYDGEQLRFDR